MDEGSDGQGEARLRPSGSMKSNPYQGKRFNGIEPPTSDTARFHEIEPPEDWNQVYAVTLHTHAWACPSRRADKQRGRRHGVAVHARHRARPPMPW